MRARRLIFTNLTFLLFALLLLLLSLLSYQRINKQVEASGLVDHTFILKISLKNAFIQLLRAESAQRGYLLTKDKNLFLQFEASKREIRPLLQRLKVLVADNEIQTKSIDSTTQLFMKRFRTLDMVIDTFSFVNAAVADSLLMQGKALSDSIAFKIEVMNNRETLLLDQRLKKQHQEENIASILILILSVFSVAILSFTFSQLKKESKLLSASIIDNNKLEEIVSERTAEIVSFNEQLNRQNEELEKKNAELNSFTFIASHDLKEPLRKIEMYSIRLVKEDEPRLSENGLNYLRKITDSVQRMKNLIDSIFSYVQVEQEIDTVITDLGETIEQSLINLADAINEKNAVIDYQGMPVIAAVPEQMEQLFTNLIGNSLKYAKKDVQPKIKITTEKITHQHDGNKWKIQVQDNGVGFDEIYKEKIFQIFQRAHSKTHFPGTGIGLAICKKIVDNHHGSISASSVNGDGAVFTIILPEK